MWHLLTKLLRGRSGTSAAEYALILAIVGSALAIAAVYLGDTIATSTTSSGETIANCGGAC